MRKSEVRAVKEVEEHKRQVFLKRELDWVRRGPRARRTKAKSRLDNFYEVSNQENIEADVDVDLIIPPAERLGKKLLNLQILVLSLEIKFYLRTSILTLKRERKSVLWEIMVSAKQLF
ncbi:MAG: hypothetical protein MZV64_60800 [Ignavibacteriales bacterium]|nr:hypothetical protein [Ignavibacteriales bacterium]